MDIILSKGRIMAKLKSLQEGLDEMRKLYGTASVFQPNDDFKSNIPSVGTGSFNLNDAIGVGGVPCGRLIMLSGVESSGKSLLALSIIREAQKEGGIGYYIDGEFTFDPDWTSRLGVDLDKIIISQTNNAKEVFELLLGKPKKEGKRLNAIPGMLSNEKILESGLKVVVIDSIDSLAPPMEVTSEVGKSNMALMARFLPPELRRLTPILAKTDITIIAIMQARQTPGQIYGDALTVSGGRALKHAASTWIDLGVMSQSKITINGKIDGEKIGHKIKAKIKKNKVAPPFKEAEFTIYFQKGIDIRPEIPKQAVEAGVIGKPSAKMYTYKSNKLGDFKWNGMNNLEEELRINKELLVEIAKKVSAAKKDQEQSRRKNTDFKENEDFPVAEATEFEDIEKNLDTEPADSSEVSEAGIESSEEKKEDQQKKSDSQGKNVINNLKELTLDRLKEIAKEKKIPKLWKYTSKNDLIKVINQTT